MKIHLTTLVLVGCCCVVLLWAVWLCRPRVHRKPACVLTEDFLLSPVEAASEYGVRHRRVMESVTLRCMGPTLHPMYLIHKNGDVELEAVLEENATRWHVYRNAEQNNFAIALASDPAFVLVASGNNVMVRLGSGASRFQWQVEAVVHSRYSLVIQVQRQGGGFLGPSWSQAGSEQQGPLSTGALKAESWQLWHIAAADSAPPSCDPPYACFWTTNYPAC